MARLAIEIANPTSAGAHASEVAVEHLGRTFTEPVAPATHQHDDLQPAIERLFRRAELASRELTHVCVSCGPGGFTATRTACAAGQMIALATGAACVRVPSGLVALHARALMAGPPGHAHAPAERVCVILASKGQTVWACVFEPQSNDTAFQQGFQQAMAGHVVDAQGLLLMRPSLVLADGHLPPQIAQALADAGVPIEPIGFHATACLHASHHCPTCPPEQLLPIYPRQPEAVTLWQTRRTKTTPETHP